MPSIYNNQSISASIKNNTTEETYANIEIVKRNIELIKSELANTGHYSQRSTVQLPEIHISKS